MKRVLSVLLATVFALMLMSGIAMAAQVSRTQLMNTTFNAVTTTANSTAEQIQGQEKVAFFVVYDETEVGNAISAAVTVDVSYDNSTYLDASFYDYAGGSTLQTSETISADGSYYMWFNKDLCVPYVRVNVALTNTDADDIANVKVYAVTKE